MKGTDILDRMNTVDLKYVREMDGSERRTARINRLRNLSVAAAACLVIAAAVPVVWWGVSHRSEPVSPIVTDAPETKPSEETKPNTSRTESVFEIENGLLVAYRGSGEAVDIPDEVTAIGADAFAQCDTGEVKTVRLGANVSEIDSAAFVSLTALENVEVAEENEYYEICDGVLAARDGSVLFDVSMITGNNRSESVEWNSTTVEYVINQLLDVGEAKIILGQLELRLDVLKDLEPPYENARRVDIISASAYGYEIEFEKPIMFGHGGPTNANVFAVDGIYCIEKANSPGTTKYLFTDEGIIIPQVLIEDPDDDDPASFCDNYIAFIPGDDGKLRYKKAPIKYQELAGGFLQDDRVTKTCVGLDEFALEEGTVEVKNGKLVYHPERTYTVEEVYSREDLEKRLEGSRKWNFWWTMKLDVEENNNYLEGITTIEELYAKNAKYNSRARSLTPAE